MPEELEPDTIAIYCKGCGALFYATCRITPGDVLEIVRYARAGHRVGTVNARVVRIEMAACTCPSETMEEDEAEQLRAELEQAQAWARAWKQAARQNRNIIGLDTGLLQIEEANSIKLEAELEATQDEVGQLEERLHRQQGRAIRAEEALRILDRERHAHGMRGCYFCGQIELHKDTCPLVVLNEIAGK